MTKMRPSSELAVRDYSLIMMWPLSVRSMRPGAPQAGGTQAVGEGDSAAAAVRAALEADKTRWEPIADKLHHLRPLLNKGEQAEDRLTPGEYAEFVYFYPFVQQFLFGQQGRGGDDQPLLSIYRFRDVDGLDIAFKTSAATFEVPRISLYLFQTGDVFLVSEICAHGDVVWDGDLETPVERRVKRPLWLSEVLDLNENLRRAYAPYFYSGSDSGNALKPGYAFKEVRWRHGDQLLNTKSERDIARCWDDLAADLHRFDRRRNPLYAHWKVFLPKFPNQTHCWRQVQDDRMPGMTSVSVDDPEQIGRGDWVRLANFDSPGSGLPYGERFLRDFEEKNCYDRFWQPRHDWQTTRYVTTGFAFAQVVKKQGDAASGWSLYQTHFRTLYFHLMLICHFHQAALQNLSDQMASAVQGANLDQSAGVSPTHKRRMEQIMGKVVQFTQGYWFSDVSNQIMARELFSLVRSHLGVDALFAEVTAEAREINAFLNRLEDQRSARASERFNIIAAIGAVLGVSVGAMGMNMLIPGQSLDWHSAYAWVFGLAVLFGTASVMFGGLTLMDAWSGSRAMRLRQWCFLVIIVIGLAICLCVLSRIPEAPSAPPAQVPLSLGLAPPLKPTAPGAIPYHFTKGD